jgi:hypothetical protein
VGASGYIHVGQALEVVASGRDSLVGVQSPAGYPEHFAECLAGSSLVTRPFPSVALLPDEQGHLRVGVPTMFAIAPICSAAGQIIAMLGLRITPDADFTRILATARAGQTGETYAFDHDGRQISESRFDTNLKRLGLIPDAPDARPTLTLELRDPLVDDGRSGAGLCSHARGQPATASGLEGGLESQTPGSIRAGREGRGG